jgi:hypothetical protein
MMLLEFSNPDGAQNGSRYFDSFESHGGFSCILRVRESD